MDRDIGGAVNDKAYKPLEGTPLRGREKRKVEKAVLEQDLLGVNLPLAKSGFGYDEIRKTSKKELIAYMDALIKQPGHKVDVDFYLRELTRREQVRTNRILLWLAIFATVAGCLQASPIAISLWHWLFG